MSRPSIYFGFGLAFLLVALLNAWVLLDYDYETQKRALDKHAVVVKGDLVEVGESVDPVTKAPIKVYTYSFWNAQDEAQMQGESFGYLTNVYPGDNVEVEYLPNQPDVNRMRGTVHKLTTRPSDFSVFLTFVGLGFVAIGLVVRDSNRSKMNNLTL